MHSNDSLPPSFPPVKELPPPKKITKKRKKEGRLYYKEDFAGLWVYMQLGEEAKLLTVYPFTLLADKAEIKAMIDNF